MPTEPEDVRIHWLNGPPAAGEQPRFVAPKNLGELVAEFLAFMAREVSQGNNAQCTLVYYRNFLVDFVNAVGAALPLADLLPYHLERFKTNRASVVCVQRLGNWAVRVGLMARSPFTGVSKPPVGQRERILERPEMCRLLRACRPPLRRALFGMRHTLARPQEVRAFRFSELLMIDGYHAFVQPEYKAKARRADKARFRVICLDARALRLVNRQRRRAYRNPPLPTEFEDFVFLNGQERPWRTNALILAFRRACARAGIPLDNEQGRLVPYSVRHSAATAAILNGVSESVLMRILGHTSLRTTQRYIHPQLKDLGEAMRIATKPR